jgi:hypothetical protein
MASSYGSVLAGSIKVQRLAINPLKPVSVFESESPRRAISANILEDVEAHMAGGVASPLLM